jgi:putative ABC transport system permease protein
MLGVTLRGIQGHLLRLLLTASAVMLGVSFVAGTFVLRGSIDQALDGLVAGASAGMDVSVRGVPVDAEGDTDLRAPVPLALVPVVAAVPGTARVSPDLQGTAILAGKDGTAVRNSGAPGLGFAFADDDPAFTLVSGRGPAGPDEVAVETSTLKKSGLVLGDTTTAVIGAQTRQVTVTGEVRFGTLFGATAVLVDKASAVAAFAPDGLVPSITVTAASGVEQRELRDAISTVLPATAQAATGDEVHQESESAIQQGLGFFTTILLVFAGVALFVGAFIIVNTFTMLMAQRSRELALLRALGASRRQILASVLGEAAAVGVVGSVLGVGLGLLLARGAEVGIQRLLGVDIGTALPLTLGTTLVSLAVGTLVTVASAVLPARRAARTLPVAAMRSEAPPPPHALRHRGVAGAALVTAGGVLLVLSVGRAHVPWIAAGAGALLAVLGMLLGAPWATRPVVRLIAWPLVRVVGAVARLARENALRVPRRTAATATALMIGLSLVAGIAVLASSVKASVSEGVASELTSDFVLNGGAAPVPTPVAAAARELPHVASVAAVSLVGLRIGSFSTEASAVSAADVRDNFVVEMSKGDLSALAGDAVLVDRSTARAQGWEVGDTLHATMGTRADQVLTVGAVYEDSQAFGSHVIVDRDLYLSTVPASQQVDRRIFVRAAPGADLTALRSQLGAIVDPYLVVSVQDPGEFAAEQGAGIDTVLNLLYVLLLFSVVIAVLGIVNTLALSVLERTREIGLLRAIGLSRRQLRGMITIEAVATAVFGAVLGTILGLGLGVALQRGLRSEGLNTLGIPWTLLVGMLLASILVGVLAAVAPAVRAARVNILQAIVSG